MKQYTTQEQTAKLIELGFEKPRGLADAEPSSGKWVREAYSIGELIEMLPKKMENEYGAVTILHLVCFEGVWRVKYDGSGQSIHIADELIDALYYMAVELKEEGVI